MYKVVSFDIFMTLADLDARVPAIWRRITGQALTDAQIEAHAEKITRYYRPYYHALYNASVFQTMGSVFLRGFREYFEAEGISLDPVSATEIFLEEHDNAPLYADAAAVLPRIAEKYPVIISSDADICMVKTLRTKFPCEKAFISEELGTYKANPESRFFRQVIDYCGVAPEEILHIGDGRPDITGAKAAGMAAYHLDRKETSAFPDIPYVPDYRERDLYPLLKILGV